MILPMNVRVTGIEKCVRAVGKKVAETKDNMKVGTEKCGVIVLRKAVYYCPKKTGALAASGRTQMAGRGSSVQVRIVFGGTSAPYALWVHEDLEKRHASPTCAKFLERAFRESRGTMTAMMKRQLQGKTTKSIDGQEV